MNKINYATLVDGRKKYPVPYLASHQSSSGKKEFGDFKLKGAELTEKQIVWLFENHRDLLKQLP